MYKTSLSGGLFAAFVSIPVISQAQATLGAGLIAVPQFEGSSDYRIMAVPSLSFSNEKISVRTVGPGIEMDLLSSRAVDVGPILRYNFGREDSNIDNAQVSALPDIAAGIEFGGYAQVNFPVGGFKTFLSPRVSAVQGVQGGASGTQFEASLGLLRLQGDWTLGARAATTYADGQYMKTNFGVGGGNTTGLAAFNAGAGIKDAGLALFANYKINERVSLTGVAGYKVLMGNAASSPIVSVAGRKEQMFLSLSVGFNF